MLATAKNFCLPKYEVESRICLFFNLLNGKFPPIVGRIVVARLEHPPVTETPLILLCSRAGWLCPKVTRATFAIHPLTAPAATGAAPGTAVNDVGLQLTAMLVTLHIALACAPAINTTTTPGWTTGSGAQRGSSAILCPTMRNALCAILSPNPVPNHPCFRPPNLELLLLKRSSTGRRPVPKRNNNNIANKVRGCDSPHTRPRTIFLLLFDWVSTPPVPHSICLLLPETPFLSFGLSFARTAS